VLKATDLFYIYFLVWTFYFFPLNCGCGGIEEMPQFSEYYVLLVFPRQKGKFEKVKNEVSSKLLTISGISSFMKDW